MTNSADQIGFEQLGIASVLAQYWLRVPPNQREYAWDEKEVSALFHDLSEAIADGAKSYFLGSLVTVPKQPGHLEVVDGQQRLATTAILLNAIREYLESINEDLIAESIVSLLSDIDTDARARVPKLNLNIADNQFFHSNILAFDKSGDALARLPSHELLLQAKELASSHVQKIVLEHKVSNHGNVLNEWVKYLRYHTTVILLKAPTTANAYKMFETLNDRGLRTSQSDLIKNYLFGQSNTRLEEAQGKWSQMRGTLETLDEEDITVTFLRQTMISLHGYIRNEDLFDKVVSQVRGVQRTMTFLDTLESASSDYVAVLNPESDKWNSYPISTRRSIQAINLLLVRPMRPLMLAVARKFSISEADIAFRVMISWCVRLLITGGGRSGAVEQPLANAAKEVTDGRISTARKLAIEIETVIPNDTQFREAFCITNVSKASLARYYLRSLEMAAKGEREPWFIPNDDRAVINLEHILPLRPEGNWPEYDAEGVKTYAKKIGNQALLKATNNSNLKSAAFSEKKKIYAESPYELTRQIADLKGWSPNDIKHRQTKLADLALRAWPLLANQS